MYPTQQMPGQSPQASPNGQVMYKVGPQVQGAMQQQSTPSVAEPPPADAYKQALIQQLSSMANPSAGQQQNTGAGAPLSAMGTVIGSMVNAYDQKQKRNFLLNNVGGGQQGWATTVTPEGY